MNALPFIALSIIINTLAQLLLKLGTNRMGDIHFSWNWQHLFHLFWQVAFNPYILLGLTCYVASVVSWLVVLSKIDVSVAYPLVSLGYILTAIAGYYFFHEAMSVTRIGGIFVILIGVYLITK